LERAVILGDFLFAMAGRFATDTGNLRVVNLFARALESISRGELKQGFSAFRLDQTYDDYIERISGKTAALFALTTESGAVLSKAPEKSVQKLKEYGYNLGIAFQIVDDILDFVSTEKEMGKPVASDLAQGTVTLPSLLLMQNYSQDNPVKRLFKNEGDKQQNINEAVEMLRNAGYIEESYRIADEYKMKACRSIKQLPDSPARRSLLSLADYVVRRQK
jgi:geranylgeranyl pyrophosphate synthase